MLCDGLKKQSPQPFQFATFFRGLETQSADSNKYAAPGMIGKSLLREVEASGWKVDTELEANPIMIYIYICIYTHYIYTHIYTQYI